MDVNRSASGQNDLTADPSNPLADAQEVAGRSLNWSALSGSVVLVTGAGGFLGSALVEALLARHDASNGVEPKRVLAMVRNVEGAKKKLPTNHPALHLVHQDLGQPLQALPHFDFAIHAASQASPKFYGVDPVGTILPNVLGTQQLLAAAVANRAKGFLFVSSGEVYGEVAPDHIPTQEDQYGYVDPTIPRSCYAESKRCGEALCVAYHQQFGLRTVIGRPFHTYGPGVALDDGRVFADFLRDVTAHANIQLRSAGAAVRAFCHVTDAVAGLLTVLLSGKAGAAYNVGNEKAAISIAELAEVIVQLFPDRQLKVERVETPVDNYVVSTISRNVPSTAKLEKLGWQARWGVQDGFRRTILAMEAAQGRLSAQ